MGKARLVLAFCTLSMLLMTMMGAVAYQATEARLDTTKHQLAQVQGQLQTTETALIQTRLKLRTATKQVAQLQDEKKKDAKAVQVYQTLSARAGGVVHGVQAIGTFRATWYTSYDAGVGHITATGKRVQPGVTVAVDPRVIPLGSTLYVKFPGGRSEVLKAEDTGGAIVGNRLDIYCTSPSAAAENGVQTVQVYLIRQ